MERNAQQITTVCTISHLGVQLAQCDMSEHLYYNVSCWITMFINILYCQLMDLAINICLTVLTLDWLENNANYLVKELHYMAVL